MSVLLDKATGITCHSQAVQPGNIFVAIRGRSKDGNRYAADAVKRGALAVVTDSPGNLPPLAVPVVVMPDARKALAQLAAELYRNPSRDISLVGITGSNGKTTIAFMLNHIYQTAGLTAGMIGTISVNTGRDCFASTLTTPDAASTQYYLSQMHKNGVTHAAMEVSAQGLEMHRVDHVKFSCGILSNICPDHLDFHNSFSSYLSAKKRFLAVLDPQTPLIVNYDDSYCREMISDYSGLAIRTSLHAAADITARVLHISSGLSRFTLSANIPAAGPRITSLNHSLTINLPLAGRHNIANAVLAAAAALHQGIDAETIAQALSTFPAVERRMDIRHIDGVTVIDDTALNPGSIDAVFSSLENFPYRRLIIVNAIRGKRGPAINAANAATIARWQKILPFILIITASAESVSPNDTVSPEEAFAFTGALNAAGSQYSYTELLSQAIKNAIDKTSPGDLLLLLGAQGMDPGFKEFTRQIQKIYNFSDLQESMLAAVT